MFDYMHFSFKVVFVLLLTAYCLPLTSSAQQRIAILTPEKNRQTETFVENLEKHLANEHKIIDKDLSKIAFLSFDYKNPFNLSSRESKNIAQAIGCDYFLLIRSKNQRRSSLEKADYYESYAVIYVISSRTGRLAFWKLQSLEAAEEDEAGKLLFDSIKVLSMEISKKITEIQNKETSEKSVSVLEEIPEENMPQAKGFRPPLPYKRIRPKYTDTARLYNIEATIDIEIDVDEAGKILRSEIVRWAGFGLDESVRKTVLEMNWRPASRNGKTLPIRALLRYNFKNIENDASK